MTLSFPPSDDDIASWIRAYDSMDPQLRSDFREAHGLTLQGWNAMVAAHRRRKEQSANARRMETSSTTKRESVYVLRVEIGGRRWYRSAPPSRGLTGSGPGRTRSGKKRLAAPQVRIVITWSEE